MTVNLSRPKIIRHVGVYGVFSTVFVCAIFPASCLLISIVRGFSPTKCYIHLSMTVGTIVVDFFGDSVLLDSPYGVITLKLSMGSTNWQPIHQWMVKMRVYRLSNGGQLDYNPIKAFDVFNITVFVKMH